MSYKPVFRVGNDPKFYDNALRFATREESLSNATAKFQVWSACVAYGVEVSDDPVNYRWVNGQLVSAEIADAVIATGGVP